MGRGQVRLCFGMQGLGWLRCKSWAPSREEEAGLMEMRISCFNAFVVVDVDVAGMFGSAPMMSMTP